MLNDNEYERALKSAYALKKAPQSELSRRIMQSAADRQTIRQVRLIAIGSAAMAICLAILARVLTGQMPLYYVAVANVFTVVLGGGVLTALYPKVSTSTKEA